MGYLSISAARTLIMSSTGHNSSEISSFSEPLANAHAYPSCYLEDLKAKKNT
jgi:hypothetical protein